MGFGHNQFLSLLFIAGVTGGLPLLILHLQQFIIALRTTLTMGRRKWGPNHHLEFLTLWGALIIVGYIVYNFLAFSFGFRGMSLWYGIGTGLMLGGRACLIKRRELAAR